MRMLHLQLLLKLAVQLSEWCEKTEHQPILTGFQSEIIKDFQKNCYTIWQASQGRYDVEVIFSELNL